MRNLLIVACSVIVMSCTNNRYEVFKINNVAPELTLSSGELASDGVWKTTERIKLGLKTEPVPFELSFSGIDQEGFSLSLNAIFDKSLTIIFDDGSPVEFPIFVENNQDLSFRVSASQVGAYPIELLLTDELGKTSKAILTVDAFENMEPIAILTKEPEAYGIPSPSVYQINANESYDQDQQWGGSIVQYIWKIDNGREFTTETSYFRQSFEPGGYSISLKVVDSDGAQSQQDIQTIVIR